MVDYIIPKIFLETVERCARKVALRHKAEGVYKDIIYQEFRQRTEAAAMGLLALGLEFQDRAGIISKNRPEWAMADLSTLWLGGISVPIYDTLIAPHIAYILNNAGVKIVFAADEEQLDKLLSIKDEIPSLKKIIVFDTVPAEKKKDYVLTFAELIELGNTSRDKYGQTLTDNLNKIAEDDICSLVYTSGTTGSPKGVMLTHKNFVSNVIDTITVIPLTGDDTLLSFLPLSHVLERMGGYYSMIILGGTIAYAASVDTVAENMTEVHPTVMISVPRFYEKMYSRVLETIESSSAIRQKIFHWGTRIGSQKFRADKAGQKISFLLKLQFAIAKKLVFAKLKQKTGGKLRFFVSGGAPLAKHLGEFFASADIIIVEGYGLTETSPVITCNRLEKFEFGSVGLAIPNVELKIAEDGEILAAGPNVMKGYYKNEEATKETLEERDRKIWCHTGDIGYIDSEGMLFITDRKKEIIVMSNGKNVAPQPIENLLKSNKYISQAVMVGNSRKFMTALIAPDFAALTKYAQENSISFSDNADLIEKPEIKDFYHREIELLMKDVPRYEQVKKFRLLPRELTQEQGELTPTLKIKRKVVDQNFAREIEELYKE
ncbi:long-chain fatty acid--CoA ligase [bacterium]|nr:long-chain fatty acid--CoA ligase [bacterium]